MNFKILAFGTSNSSKSINKKLVSYAASLLTSSEITLLDVNDFPVPLFGVDVERAEGIPQAAYDFRGLIEKQDGLILSMAEHNGAYTAAFKNLFDWISRIPGSAWEDKPMLLLATSPGARGASSVLDIASRRFPFNGGKVKDTFSLPLFNENFSDTHGITHPEKKAELVSKIRTFETSL